MVRPATPTTSGGATTPGDGSTTDGPPGELRPNPFGGGADSFESAGNRGLPRMRTWEGRPVVFDDGLWPGQSRARDPLVPTGQITAQPSADPDKRPATYFTAGPWETSSGRVFDREFKDGQLVVPEDLQVELTAQVPDPRTGERVNLDFNNTDPSSTESPLAYHVAYRDAGACDGAARWSLKKAGYENPGGAQKSNVLGRRDIRSRRGEFVEFVPQGRNAAVGSKPQITMLTELDGALARGNMAMVEVDYKPGNAGGMNPDGVGDHWMVMMGRGYEDDGRVYYTAMDNVYDGAESLKKYYVTEDYTLRAEDGYGSPRTITNLKLSVPTAPR